MKTHLKIPSKHPIFFSAICSANEKRYRYGFNGKEKDNETNREGNAYDFGARIYDSRLGRWMSLDPLMKNYPCLSPYSFCNNNPIIFIDKDGKKIDLSGLSTEEVTKYNAHIEVLKSSKIFATMYEKLEQSSINFKISNSVIDGGGGAQVSNILEATIQVDLGNKNTPGTEHTTAQELFHGFQLTNRSNWDPVTTISDIEVESEVATFLIMEEVYMNTCIEKKYELPKGGKILKYPIELVDEEHAKFEKSELLTNSSNRPNPIMTNEQVTSSGFNEAYQKYKQMFQEAAKADEIATNKESKTYTGPTSSARANNIISLIPES